MSEFSQCQYYNLIILSAFLVNLSTAYKTLSTDSDKLCSPLKKREVKLGVDSHSGLVVTLGRLQDHPLEWKSNFLCKFEVENLRKSNGIFAVIQRLAFRRNDTNGECIDYVQYQRKNGTYSQKYCGQLHAATAMDTIYVSDAVNANFEPTFNAFDEPESKLNVFIYISRKPLLAYEEMDLEIVFTSYQRCYSSIKNYRSCNDKYHKCIYKDYFGDRFVNCPYSGCLDEDGCTEQVHKEQKKSVGNKVIIGSVTLLLVFFLFFICFVWLCRKYKKLCWAEEFANPNGSTQNARTIEMEEPSLRNMPMPSTGSSVQGNLSSAVGASAAVEDKDLPPSYESLFPNR